MNQSAQTNDEVLLEGFPTSLEQFEKGDDGVTQFKGQFSVSFHEELKNEVLYKAYNSKYTNHPGVMKIYQDMKRMYWLLSMKRDVSRFVSKCLSCEKVKFEHQRQGGQLQTLEIDMWKWENLTCDFVVGLP